MTQFSQSHARLAVLAAASICFVAGTCRPASAGICYQNDFTSLDGLTLNGGENWDYTSGLSLTSRGVSATTTDAGYHGIDLQLPGSYDLSTGSIQCTWSYTSNATDNTGPTWIDDGGKGKDVAMWVRLYSADGEAHAFLEASASGAWNTLDRSIADIVSGTNGSDGTYGSFDAHHVTSICFDLVYWGPSADTPDYSPGDLTLKGLSLQGAATPEPFTLMLGAGGLATALLRRRSRRSSRN
jgi:hypothetical protein